MGQLYHAGSGISVLDLWLARGITAQNPRNFNKETHLKKQIKELEARINRLERRIPILEKKISVYSRNLLVDRSRFMTIEVIQKLVAKVCNVTLQKICGPTREQQVADARSMAMSLCVDYKTATTPSIGLAFGNRDHSTVVRARKKAVDLKEHDQLFRKRYEQCSSALEKHFASQGSAASN